MHHCCDRAWGGISFVPVVRKMSNLWSFVIEGDPVVQQRPRKGKYGNFYDPSSKEKKSLGYKILSARQQVKMTPLYGAIQLSLQFHIQGAKRADCDNLAKAFMDAANGILWKDDSQVCELMVKKTFNSDIPRTVCQISSLL